MARPRKEEGEHYVWRAIRFPPDLWERLVAIAPARQRSAVVQEGLRRELKRLEAKARKEKPDE